MKRNLFSLNIRSLLRSAAIIGLGLSVEVQAQTKTETETSQVTQSASSQVKGATVYSIRFPGGSASEFFNFLRTNGFASDTILFAGKAGDVHVPDFTVKNVRLKQVAKSIELVTEDRLKVEVEESGEQSDVNVWRIKLSERVTPIKTRACAMPNLFRSEKARNRVSEIAEAVEMAIANEMDAADRHGGHIARGSTRTLESEKVVVVVGSEAYVDAVASALEAAEKVAATQAGR